jgi:hypothetical protein
MGKRRDAALVAQRQIIKERPMTDQRPPLPPFTFETAVERRYARPKTP